MFLIGGVERQIVDLRGGGNDGVEEVKPMRGVKAAIIQGGSVGSLCRYIEPLELIQKSSRLRFLVRPHAIQYLSATDDRRDRRTGTRKIGNVFYGLESISKVVDQKIRIQ